MTSTIQLEVEVLAIDTSSSDGTIIMTYDHHLTHEKVRREIMSFHE